LNANESLEGKADKMRLKISMLSLVAIAVAHGQVAGSSFEISRGKGAGTGCRNCRELSERVLIAEGERDQEKTDAARLRQELIDRTRLVASLQAATSKAEAELASATAKLAAMAEEKTRAESNLTELRNKLTQMENADARTAAELARLQREITDRDEQLKALAQQLHPGETAGITTGDALEVLKKQLERLNFKYMRGEEEQGRLSQKRWDMKRQLRDKQERIAELEGALKNCRELLMKTSEARVMAERAGAVATAKVTELIAKLARREKERGIVRRIQMEMARPDAELQAALAAAGIVL
jgi:DNA repair exonuclease SbcCD ATPase subunit